MDVRSADAIHDFNGRRYLQPEKMQDTALAVILTSISLWEGAMKVSKDVIPLDSRHCGLISSFFVYVYLVLDEFGMIWSIQLRAIKQLTAHTAFKGSATAVRPA